MNRSWIAQYRYAGATRRALLGTAAVLRAEPARAAARKILAAVALGHDPQGERADRRDKDRLSFRAVVAEYLGSQAAGAAPQHVDADPALPHRPPISARCMASRWTASPAGTSPPASSPLSARTGSMSALQARDALMRSLSGRCTMGLAENNPVIGAVKPKDHASRERALSEAELAAVWRASGDDDYGRIVRLLILTGCRRQEIGGMRWSELDAEHGTWTLPGRAQQEWPGAYPAAAAGGVGHHQQRPAHGRPRSAFRGSRGRGFTAWAQGKAGLDRRLGDTVAPVPVARSAAVSCNPHGRPRRAAARHRANLEPPERPQARRRRDLQSKLI